MAVAIAFSYSANESALIAEIHRVGHVLELRYEDNDALDRRARSAGSRAKAGVTRREIVVRIVSSRRRGTHNRRLKTFIA